MNTLPAPSTATPYGLFSRALVAAAPSPENPAVPLPAKVSMNPVTASTLRTRWLYWSAMNTLPAPSTATPIGLSSWASVAAAPSPENPRVPLPAKVLINPVPTSTRRTRWLEVSAMNTLPPPSTATPIGEPSRAPAAAAPSPENPAIPVPAIVLINPVTASIRRTRWLEASAMNTLPTPSTATPYGKFSWAPVAAAPSPENPEGPVPAIVLMSPAAARAVPPNPTVTTTTTTQKIGR